MTRRRIPAGRMTAAAAIATLALGHDGVKDSFSVALGFTAKYAFFATPSSH